MSISDIIAEAMFKSSNSPPPKKRTQTQTRHQLQQQEQYLRSTKICCLSLHGTNKIRLINAPQSLVSPLRLAIFETWDHPIQHETSLPQCGGHEFKLKGKPWGPSPKTGPLVASTNLILAMLQVLEIRGWSLLLAANMSHIREEMDSMFFEWLGPKSLLSSTLSWGSDPDNLTLVDQLEQRNDESTERDKAEGDIELFTVDFSGYDRIRVTAAPVAIITALRLAILRHWKQGIHKEGVIKGSYEFKLAGFPFQTWGSETSIETSMMLIQALDNMRLHGFELCLSMDLKAVEAGKKEKKTDPWVLRRSTRGRRKDELRQSRLECGSDNCEGDDRDEWVVHL